jgi:ribosomal protein L11 methylase PrmA
MIQSLFGVPYVPSSTKAVRAALAQLNLEGKKFVDLGSGDGMVVLSAAHLGANAHGVEINPILVLLSKLRAKITNKSAHFKRGSYHDFPVTDADIVFIYLLPKTMAELLPRLKAELKPGAIVVSNTFAFPEISPTEKLNSKFLVYRF